jgi:hypothetical protein
MPEEIAFAEGEAVPVDKFIFLTFLKCNLGDFEYLLIQEIYEFGIKEDEGELEIGIA